MANIYYITGIDTGIGKTFAAGMLARYLHRQGKSVITAKLAQTGCSAISEDIIEHRKIMDIDLLPEDNVGITCPYVFKLPASPHLAAATEDKVIDPEVIIFSINKLAEKYDYILIEGAGGLMVPLSIDLLAIDLAAGQNWPLIIVSSSRLGSINHTLMTLECAAARECKISGIIYNLNDTADSLITDDSRNIIKDKLINYNDKAELIDLPAIKDEYPEIDFSALFE